MKLPLYLILCAVLLNGCGSSRNIGQGADKELQKLTRQYRNGEKAYDLELNILNVKTEKSGNVNRLKVDYEIVNHSPVEFDRIGFNYYAYFTIYTAEGRELGHQDRLYTKIPSGKTIIQKETIELSIYTYDEIRVELYAQKR